MANQAQPPHRLPLQGGLAPTEGLAGSVVEVACDESGFSGRNLFDAATPLVTHASVDLSVDEAVELIATLRSASRFSLPELKSGPLLRSPDARESLDRFLTALAGRARVQVVDKELFLVTRVVDLFLAEPSYAAGTRLSADLRPAAHALHGARGSGGAWPAFLSSFVDLVRTKRRRDPDRGLLDGFFAARDALARATSDRAAATVLGELTRDRVADVVTRLTQDDRSIPPPLEPMLPALAETVLSWSGGERRVLVVHDEQSALTADRLRRLQDALAEGAGVPGPGGGAAASPLAGLVAVDSRDDPRVQVADLLAGLARRRAGAEPALEPFLSPTSLWDRSRGLPR